MSGMNKITVERNQKALLELVAKPGNDICADCKTRNPRWASHNLGIFICMNCASIHRKLGTHISKVKSITLDSWTKEQVEVMKNNGNVKSNHYYNPNEIRNPPPPSMMEGERDSELEQYIRSKYQYKRFIDKSAIVASKLGPSRSASSVSPSLRPSVPPAPRPSTVAIPNITTQTQKGQTQMAQTRSVSQSLVTPSQSQQPQPSISRSGPWEDLISLQVPAVNPSLPLQFQSTAPTQPFNIPNPGSQQNTFGNGNMSITPGYGVGWAPNTNTIGMNPTGMTMGSSTNPFLQLQQQQQLPGQTFPSSMPSPGFGASSFGQQYFGGGSPAQLSVSLPTQQQQFFQPQPLAPQQQVLQQQMLMTGTPQLQQQQLMSHSPQPQHLMPQSHSPFGVAGSHSPFGGSHSPFGGSHSPFGQQQQGQVQGQQMFLQAGGYQAQQWGQGGFVGGQGQQQWGAM